MSHICMSHVMNVFACVWFRLAQQYRDHTYAWVTSQIRMSHGTHMNESWHTYEYNVSVWFRLAQQYRDYTYTYESCLRYEWVMAHAWRSHGTYGSEIHVSDVPLLRAILRVMSHISMSHVTHTNESCHTYEWVMSYIWMSHVTHMSESCHAHEWVMSHIRMGHGTDMNESCHTYEWGMSQIQISQATHLNTSRHTYGWVMSNIWISHVTMCTICVAIWICHVTQTNQWCHTSSWHH